MDTLQKFITVFVSMVIASVAHAGEPTVNPLEMDKFYELGLQHLTNHEYSQKLLLINHPYAQRLAQYYAQITPVKTIYVKNFVYDCIPFDQQQSIIGLPVAEKNIITKAAKNAAEENLKKLQQPENYKLYKAMLDRKSNTCPFDYVSQVRPFDASKYSKPSKFNQQNDLMDGPVTNYAWAQLMFPGNSPNLLTVDMNTQPTTNPVGGITPNTFFAANDINAYTPTNPSECIINVQWLTSPNYPNQSIEYGWQTWNGVSPFLFSYGNSNGWKNGWPGNIPVTLIPNVPFPLNQPNNYYASLSLYYILSSKGPNDPACLNDPNGCYVMQVATMDQGVRSGGFWNIGFYTKKPGNLPPPNESVSNFVYQGFTQWHFGLEVQCQAPQKGMSCSQAVCAAGAFYNAGTTYLSTTNQRLFNLRDFNTAAPGISSNYSPGILPEGQMEFSGCSEL